MSRSGLGTFSDGFGMVLKKMSDEVEQSKFSEMAGSIFPELGRFIIICLAYYLIKIIKNIEIQFSRIFI